MNKTAYYLQISTLINQADLKLTELNEFIKQNPETTQTFNQMYVRPDPNIQIHDLLQKAFELCIKEFN